MSRVQHLPIEDLAPIRQPIRCMRWSLAGEVTAPSTCLECMRAGECLAKVRRNG